SFSADVDCYIAFTSSTSLHELASSTIIVHGGAGEWPELKQATGLSGVRQAATRGFGLIQRGGSALRVVETAVMEMEDNPIFNAGRGSTLNVGGEVEGGGGTR